jgi:hypothetical protein
MKNELVGPLTPDDLEIRAATLYVAFIRRVTRGLMSADRTWLEDLGWRPVGESRPAEVAIGGRRFAAP